MFRQLFNFGFQRTALQAVGFYLFYLLIAALIGGISALAAQHFGLFAGNDFEVGLEGGIKVGKWVAPIPPIVIGALVAAPRPLNVVTVLSTLLAFGVSFIAGWLGAGILISFLTTRPSRLPAV